MKTTGLLFAAAAAVASAVCVTGTAHATAPSIDATFSCDDHGDLYITVHLDNPALEKIYDLTIESGGTVFVDELNLAEGATEFGPYDDGDYHVVVMDGSTLMYATVQPITCWPGAEVLTTCNNGELAIGVGIYDEQNWTYDITIDETLVAASAGSNAKGTHTLFWPVAAGTHHVRIDWVQSNIDQPLFDGDVNLSTCGIPEEPSPDTTDPTPAEQESDGTLPMTGSHDNELSYFAVAFLLGGLGLVAVSARRAAARD